MHKLAALKVISTISGRGACKPTRLEINTGIIAWEGYCVLLCSHAQVGTDICGLARSSYEIMLFFKWRFYIPITTVATTFWWHIITCKDAVEPLYCLSGSEQLFGEF